MKCPHCRSPSLSAASLSGGPEAHRCTSCGGVWIRDADYRAWQAKAAPPPAEDPCPELPVSDSREAKLCPDCGRLLIRFKVHPDVSFRLEHCGGCGGTWYDRNEWDVLRTRCLHLNINEFFTPIWQQELRRAEIRRHLEGQYKERFGPEDFARLKEVKTWLDGCAKRSEMLAFLTSEDPYQ